MNIETDLKQSFISYAMAVIISRALPDVRDGLKPVHRRIIYAMSELGVTPDKPYRKSARIVGDVLGKYHPHGDTAVYDAMVRLAQDFSTRYVLVEGQGNFGSVDGDGAAAMRYTEARMSKLNMYLLGEIDKDTVDFYPNFDGTLMQPAVLPARFPNLLVNGSNGIAVGMATNIPPHNLREVIDGVVCLIDNPDATLDDLMQFIKGPDFPTGGVILGRRGIREAYFTGHGRIIVRAKSEIEAMAGGRNRIVVTEIPYMVNKAKLIEKIAELVHDKRIEGISDIRDESDRNGMRIVIELKKDVPPVLVLNTLYKHTQLQDTFGANMLALVDGQPRVLSLRDMLYYYLEHQKDVVTRRTKYDLDKAQARAHILEGLLKALQDIDEVVRIIRTSKDTSAAREGLMTSLALSEKQAQAILDMRLARLTALETGRLEEEYAQLEKDIAGLNAILGDEKLLMQVIKDEILEIRRKFGDDRRTEISSVEGEIDVEDLIAEDDMVVTLTHYGYIKRLPSDTYRAQNRGGKGVAAMTTREEDYAEQIRVINTHSDIMFFTNRGRVYTLKCYQIPEAGRTAKGMAIVNLLQLSGNEKVTTIIPVPKDCSSKYLMMATRGGMIKKTSMEEFQNLRKSGLISIVLRDDDELVSVELTDGSHIVMLGSRMGKAIRFDESAIRAMGRVSMGVHSMRLDEGDSIISMAVVEDGADVLAITENGFGKRTSPDEYRETNRNGKGVRAMNLSEKTGMLAAQLMVHPDEDIMLITDDGTIIRMKADDIRLCGRATQGVKLMRVGEGSRVVGVARAEAIIEEEAETEAADGEQPETDSVSEANGNASSELDFDEGAEKKIDEDNGEL
ncbi:MAG: DNA gyrase subunit A [Eubacteriales bacterium]|nr:DNA gyrase subunit A [Eubacteriales bacterium]MDD3882685.1 DNA gyrase subunit A [Eubacteriales bacterium]MDD4512743.1 DNA gyrase subunit A [Eubacteriales bacterium]